jgi:hypothetical protein
MGYEVQASLRLFTELDSSLRWNDDASEAWTPNPSGKKICVFTVIPAQTEIQPVFFTQ